jgi:hypothetical protein
VIVSTLEYEEYSVNHLVKEDQEMILNAIHFCSREGCTDGDLDGGLHNPESRVKLVSLPGWLAKSFRATVSKTTLHIKPAQAVDTCISCKNTIEVDVVEDVEELF